MGADGLQYLQSNQSNVRILVYEDKITTYIELQRLREQVPIVEDRLNINNIESNNSRKVLHPVSTLSGDRQQ